jgi:hypothetical protein
MPVAVTLKLTHAGTQSRYFSNFLRSLAQIETDEYGSPAVFVSQHPIAAVFYRDVAVSDMHTHCPVPDRLADPTLTGWSGPLGRPSARYLNLCVPTRLLLGLALAIGGRPASPAWRLAVQAVILLFLLLFLATYTGLGARGGRDSRVASWKNYHRAALALLAAATAVLAGRWQLAGVFVAVDALIGLESRHTFGALA